MDGHRFDEVTKTFAALTSRRGILRGLLGGAVGSAAVLRSRGGRAAEKVVICHLTGSETNPVVQIEVSVNAIPAHEAHGDVIDPDFENDPANCGGCLVSCDDGDPCTIDTCEEGVCVNTPLDCSAFSDQCNVGVCVDGECVADPVDDLTPCDDGDACTEGETCQGGVCTGGGDISCNDNNACTEDSCDSTIGCVHTPISCDDGNICTTDTCDPATGCVNTLPPCDPPKIINPETCVCECEDVSLCAAGFDENCNCLCTQLVCETNVEFCGPTGECACGVTTDGIHFCGPTPCGQDCTTTADCPAGFFCEAPGSCCGRQTCVGPCGSGITSASLDGRTRTGK